MKEVLSNPFGGQHLTRIELEDKRWPSEQGWVKFSQRVNDVEIHYVYNQVSGAVDDFKFK